MTVSNTVRKSGPYIGNGTTNTFQYEFSVREAGHIKVIKTVNDIDAIVDSAEYSVTGVGNPAGGNVVFTVPPLDAIKITILSNIPYTQLVDLQNQGAYYAQVVEDALDLAAQRDQQIQEQLDRAITISAAADPTTAKQVADAVLALDDITEEIIAVAGVSSSVEALGGIASEMQFLADNAALFSQTASAAVMQEDRFVGDGATVLFNLTTAPASAANVDVWVGGSIQNLTNYTVVGTALTLDAAPPLNSPIVARTRTLVSANEVYAARDATLAAAAAVPAFSTVGLTIASLMASVADAGKVLSINPAGTGVILTAVPNGSNTYFPEDYGAKADTVIFAASGSMTAGSANLTVTGAAFVVGDVGKRITVRGAGAGGRPLWGTIVSRTSATVVVVSAAASTTVAAAKVIYGTDDTTALQACLNAAGPTRGQVRSRGGRMTISSVTVKAGTTFVEFPVVGCGASPSAATGLVNLETGMTDITISVDIDMAAGWGDGTTTVGATALLGSGNKRVVAIRTNIYNMGEGCKYGYWLIGSPEECKVLGCSFTGLFLPVITQNMCSLQGNPIAFGGYLPSGATARATLPAKRNVVQGTTIVFGSYAVILGGAEDNVINGNVFHGQNHRGVYLGPAGHFNSITGNIIRHSLSTAILAGYFCCDNVISGNDIFKDHSVHVTPAGEAAININTGSARNKVIGNRIAFNANYGVYCANGASDTFISGNDIRGYYRAAICVDSDWAAALGGAIYSRPNYAPPTDVLAGSTGWTFANTNDVVIQNNIIGPPTTGVYASIAAIAIAQPASSAYGVFRTVIDGNKILDATNLTHYLHVLETTSGRIVGTKMTGNSFHLADASKFLFTRGRDHFGRMTANEVLDDLAAELAVASGTTQPSVAYGSSLLLGTTAGTSVTYFTGGLDGQEIEVRLGANWTIVQNTAFIRLKGATNIVGTSANQIVGFRRKFGIWFETWRNF